VITDMISHGQAASGGHRDEGEGRQRHDARTRRDQHDRQERIEPELDQRIPGGMEGRGEQHDAEDERVHSATICSP
jgi:hypothetical protein